MATWFFSIIVLLCSMRANADNCPVSSSMHTKLDGLLTYPLDIFDVSQFNSLKKSRSVNSNTNIFKCSSAGEKPFQLHYCSSLTACPIKREQIQAATSRIPNWPVKTSFCKLRQHLADPTAEVRIIIVGGSVTVGTESGGCCCREKLEPRCAMFSSQVCPLISANDEQFCRWSNLFATWLKSYSRAKVTMVNAAISGADSKHMAEIVADELHQKHGIKYLTDRDIVFIDHSINDGISSKTTTGFRDVSNGIQNLLLAFRRLSHNASWPSMVILEQWPIKISKPMQCWIILEPMLMRPNFFMSRFGRTGLLFFISC